MYANNTKLFDHMIRQKDMEGETKSVSTTLDVIFCYRQPVGIVFPHAVGQRFQCSHCSKRFATERLLRDHMRTHGQYWGRKQFVFPWLTVRCNRTTHFFFFLPSWCSLDRQLCGCLGNWHVALLLLSSEPLQMPALWHDLSLAVSAEKSHQIPSQ